MNKTLKNKLEIYIIGIIEIYKKALSNKRTDMKDIELQIVSQMSDQVLSLFEEMGTEVIGKDENHHGERWELGRNELRTEQRIKLKELLGK